MFTICINDLLFEFPTESTQLHLLNVSDMNQASSNFDIGSLCDHMLPQLTCGHSNSKTDRFVKHTVCDRGLRVLTLRP